jgi:hypothetical protein
MARETWQKILDPAGFIFTDPGLDPRSAEFREKAQAMGAQTPAYQSAFAASEQDVARAMAGSGAIGTQQAALAEALRAQAEGRGPSLAQMQYRQALEASQAATASQLATARGLSPAQAQRLALTQQAGQRASMAGQSAALRAQEQQSAQAALGNLLTQQRQQELLGGQLASGMYGTAGQLGLGGAQLEQRAKEAVMGVEQQRMERETKAGGAALSAFGTALGVPLSKKKTSARGGDIKSRLVPGTAKYSGDTRSNDTVPALLSPGEIVLPRSVAQSEDAPDKAKKFVQAIKKQKRPSPKAYAQALARLQELESRMDAMEALADLEAEEEG